MVVKKSIEAFLGLELLPGVEAPSTTQRYALLTPASFPGSAEEIQERTADWGEPPYPGALIPLDARSDLEQLSTMGTGPGLPAQSVELPTLFFRADTAPSASGTGPSTAEESPYAETARAYVREVETTVERLTRAASAASL